MNDLLADRFRRYLAERKATFTEAVMGGQMHTIEEYRSNIGAYMECADMETEITNIMKDINGVGGS